MSNPDHQHQTEGEIPPDDQDELPGMPEPDPYAPLFDWLERKWGRERRCPYCGVNQWLVALPLRISAVPPEHELSSVFYTREYFTVTCTNCGQTVFVNRDVGEVEQENPVGPDEPEAVEES